MSIATDRLLLILLFTKVYIASYHIVSKVSWVSGWSRASHQSSQTRPQQFKATPIVCTFKTHFTMHTLLLYNTYCPFSPRSFVQQNKLFCPSLVQMGLKIYLVFFSHGWCHSSMLQSKVNQCVPIGFLKYNSTERLIMDNLGIKLVCQSRINLPWLTDWTLLSS